MAKNTGKPYEKLTQQVFQAILDQESDVETVTVEHDVTLPGMTANSHQIDVLWRFKRGGIEHLVIVQCKDHADNVAQGNVFTFKTVLGDIAGQPRGVFVARSGFQQGARDYARAHGITLYELRKPLERDWKGRIRNIVTDVSMYVPDFRNHEVQADSHWFGAELERLHLPESTTVRFTGGGDVTFENEAGEGLMTLNDMANALAPKGFIEQDWTKARHVFESPTFLRTPNDPNFNRIKLEAWALEVKVSKAVGPRIEVRGDDVVSCILFDVLGGERQTFDEDGKPLGRHRTNDGPADA